MSLLYRVLGMAAAVNQYLWRHRINFVPLNLVLVGVACALFVFYATSWEEASRSGATPRAMPLSSLTIATPVGSFVRTSGVLAPEAEFEYGEVGENGNLKKTTMEFIPLVDLDSERGVFVQVDPPGRYGRTTHRAEVTGMLRPMQEFLARELRPVNFQQDGIQMLPTFVLVADDNPGDAGSWQLGAAVTGAVLLLFLVLTIKQNVIFRPAAMLAEISLPPAAENTMFATGMFVLEKHKKRFINVPTVLGTLDTGDLAAFANVDASSNFMGVTYATRAGIWVLPIACGSLQGIEEGTLYFGRRALPAVRFQYRDASSAKTRTGILSASGGSSRALVAALTSTATGFSPRAADPVAGDVTSSAHLAV
jgi:hypothetical protein